MEISLDSLDFNDIARRLIDIAAGKLPSPVGGFVGFVAKEMFFPAPKVDIWAQIEKRVESMVDDRSAEVADQVVNRRYGLALMARLRGFSDGFRNLLLIADDDHRNLQLALLSNQLDQLTGELILIPPALLPTIRVSCARWP